MIQTFWGCLPQRTWGDKGPLCGRCLSHRSSHTDSLDFSTWVSLVDYCYYGPLWWLSVKVKLDTQGQKSILFILIFLSRLCQLASLWRQYRQTNCRTAGKSQNNPIYLHKNMFACYRLFSHHRTVCPTFSFIGDTFERTIILRLT